MAYHEVSARIPLVGGPFYGLYSMKDDTIWIDSVYPSLIAWLRFFQVDDILCNRIRRNLLMPLLTKAAGLLRGYCGATTLEAIPMITLLEKENVLWHEWAHRETCLPPGEVFADVQEMGFSLYWVYVETQAICRQIELFECSNKPLHLVSLFLEHLIRYSSSPICNPYNSMHYHLRSHHIQLLAVLTAFAAENGVPTSVALRKELQWIRSLSWFSSATDQASQFRFQEELWKKHSSFIEQQKVCFTR